MKAAILLTTLFPAGLLAAFLGSSAARQEDEPKARAPEARRIRAVQIAEPQGPTLVQPPAGDPMARPRRNFTVRTHAADGGHGPVVAFARHGGSDKTHQAIEKLRNAESDDEKSEAREELKEALAEEFDEFLKHQSEELEQMEERLEKLRAQLEKRRDAKDDLVDRRLQMLVDEAEGMGWPGRGFGGFGGGATGAWSYEFAPAPAAYGLSVPAPGVPGAPAVVAEVDVIEAIPSAEEPEEAEEADEDESKERRPQPRPRRGAR
jgi:hypothetical protein